MLWILIKGLVRWSKKSFMSGTKKLLGRQVQICSDKDLGYIFLDP